jgi:hypothetical protein
MQAAASGAEGLFETPFAAVAATSAVGDKVLQLRCLLVYHLQASLLYDAEVGATGSRGRQSVFDTVLGARKVDTRVRAGP